MTGHFPDLKVTKVLYRVVLNSPVRSTLFTLDRQNSNQVSENSCAEAVPSTPPSEVVWSKLRSRDQTIMAERLNGIKTYTNISFKTRNSSRNNNHFLF